MSQSNKSSNGSFSSNGKKTNYNKHFPRSFLLNYGAAIQDISEEGVLNRLHDWNCEWLKRPNIAMSEMAMTVKDNLPLLRQFSGSIFNEQFVEDLVAPFAALRDALAKLDNKDKTNNEPATRQDVITALRTIDEDDQLDQAIQDAYNAAGPMFMISVQLMAIQTLMRNPQDFADKSSRTPQNEHFRQDPTPKRMRDYLLDAIIKRRRPIARNVSMWEDDDDDDDDDDQSGARAAPRRRFQRTSSQPSRERGQRGSSTWQDSTPRNSRAQTSRDSGVASSRSSDTRRNNKKPPAAAKKKKKQKKRIPPDSSQEKSSDDEENTQNVKPPAKKSKVAKPPPKTSKKKKQQKYVPADSSEEKSSDDEEKTQNVTPPAKKNKVAQPPPKTSTPKKTSKPVPVLSSSSSSSESESSDEEERPPPKKKSKPAENETQRPSAATSSTSSTDTKGKQPVNGPVWERTDYKTRTRLRKTPGRDLAKQLRGKPTKRSEH